MANFGSFTSSIGRPRINFAGGTSSSAAAFSLNSAAVIGTSGQIIGIRHVATEATPIDALYVLLHGVGGTLGNITMECSICNENTATRSGTTVRDTSTACAMPDGATKWIKFTFGTPYTPTVGEILWFNIYNTAASPATDYPQIRTATNCFNAITAGASAQNTGVSTAFTNTAGFSSNGTNVTKMPYLITQGSNHYGNPFTIGATTYYTNNTRERGIVFTLPVAMTIAGVQWNTPVGNASGIKFYASATAPGGTALGSYATGSDTNEVTDELICAKMFDTALSLAAGTYKCVLTFGSSIQIPTVQQIEDYSSYSAVFDAFYDGFNRCYGAIDDGAGGWTLDRAISPDIELLLGSFTASTPGALLTHPGMTGGCQG